MPKFRVYAVIKGMKLIGEFEARNTEHAENIGWSEINDSQSENTEIEELVVVEDNDD